MKNCLIQKLYGFKGGEIWEYQFFCKFRNFKVIFISFNWIIYSFSFFLILYFIQ